MLLTWELWRDSPHTKDTDWTWVEKIFHANGKDKKAGVAIFTSDKIDFKMKSVTKDKERHYIMIKGLIQEEDLTLINIHAPNRETPKYAKSFPGDSVVKNLPALPKMQIWPLGQEDHL